MFKKKFACVIIFILLCYYCVPFVSVYADDSVFVWSDMSQGEAISTASVINSKEGNFLNLTCGRSSFNGAIYRYYSL